MGRLSCYVAETSVYTNTLYTYIVFWMLLMQVYGLHIK